MLRWSDDAWNDYLYWQGQDKKTLKRVNALIRDAMRSPFTGLGKPEPLKWELQGAWSRRIDSANRLVYMVDRRPAFAFVVLVAAHDPRGMRVMTSSFKCCSALTCNV